MEPDVAAAVEAACRDRHVGVSAAVNQLIREGLAGTDRAREPFVQRTSSMGARVDVSNIGEVLELLDEPRSS